MGRTCAHETGGAKTEKKIKIKLDDKGCMAWLAVARRIQPTYLPLFHTYHLERHSNFPKIFHQNTACRHQDFRCWRVRHHTRPIHD